MTRFVFSVFLLFSFILFMGESFSQSSNHVVHIQTWKLKAAPVDSEADAFNDMLKRQSDVMNKDSRVLRSYVLRHNWGADSRDLVMVAEYNNLNEMFSFYEELDALMEKEISKEQGDKDGELWNKYVGMHSDEIYQVTEGTRK